MAAPVGAVDWTRFKDPEDGKFDLSGWLLGSGSGFLPLPILITEPALSGGLGVALTFFHGSAEPLPGTEDEAIAALPPSVSAIVGAYTGNHSWVGGGGHFGSWRQDRIRYTGAAGLASINLEFFIADNPLKYNVDGGFLLQEIQFRIRQTPLFVGLRYTLLSVDATFDDPGALPPGAPRWNGDAADGRDAGLGWILHYDSRDNLFAPTGGNEGWLIYTLNDSAVGSDFDYDKIEGKWFSYQPLCERFILGLRLDGARVGDGAPFYSLPFVDLRGIPIGRYQDEQVGIFELEGLWNLVGRWTLVGFGGVGHIDGDLPQISESQSVWAGGVGFRYLLARRLA